MRPLPPMIASISLPRMARMFGQVAPVALTRPCRSRTRSGPGCASPTKSAAIGLVPGRDLLDQHRAPGTTSAPSARSTRRDRAQRVAAVEDVVEHQHRAPAHVLAGGSTFQSTLPPVDRRRRSAWHGRSRSPAGSAAAAAAGRRRPPRRPSPPAPADTRRGSSCRDLARRGARSPPAPRPRHATQRRRASSRKSRRLGLQCRGIAAALHALRGKLRRTPRPTSGCLRAELDRRLQVAELGAAVVARAAEAVRQHALLREQRGDGVGELDLAAARRA